MRTTRIEDGIDIASLGPIMMYISDIPNEGLPTKTFIAPAETYMSALRAYLGIEPSKAKISFLDDTWDFGQYFVSANKRGMRVNFGKMPVEIKEASKFYAIHRMLRGAQVETIQGDTARLVTFFIRFKQAFPMVNAYDISYDNIQVIFNEWTSTSYHYKVISAVYRLYSFISANNSSALSVDLKKLAKMVERKGKSERVAHHYRKTPNIPEEYVRKIERTALDVMRNNLPDTVKYNMRMVACYLIFSMWTGLRASELLTVRIDGLHTEWVNRGTQKAHFIAYTCSKKSRTNNHELIQYSFCPELAIEAFQTAIVLRKEEAERRKEPITESDYLFDLINSHGKMFETPINTQLMANYVDEFFLTYLREDALKAWDRIKPHRIKSYDKEFYKTPEVKVTVPTPNHYRVHLCSYFYSHGVDLPFIEMNMGHLSCDMAAYYYRKEDETHQKELRTAATFIRNIVANEYEPLGANGPAISKDIKAILSRTKYDVYKDIEKMVDVIGKKYIIRAKLVGVCVKLAPTTCKTDDMSDKMMCAFGYCKNILHFFYMLDVTYASFSALTQSYQANLIGGHINAAQHELQKLHNHIKIRLEPEIKQLEEVLTSKGYDAVVSEHPQLVEIIHILDKIKKEIVEWKNRTK